MESTEESKIPTSEHVDAEVRPLKHANHHPGHHDPHHVVHGLVEPTRLFGQEGDGHVTKKYLLPRPTNDPRDPLVWSSRRKHAAFASICFFVFSSNYVTGSLSPILVSIAEEFHTSVNKASYLVTFNILFLGIGNLFWIPLAQKIGKRPVIIAGTLINFAGCVWSAKANSWGSMFASRIVAGTGASLSEVLTAAVVADVYFLDRRGAAMGVYVINIAFGNSLGSIFGGLIANATPNWRWVMWMCAILAGANVLVAIVFQAETNFDRPAETEDGEGFTMDQLADLKAQNRTPYLKSLSLTGYYDRHQSIWWLFARPWTLLRYPAVLWAALTHGVLLGWVAVQLTADGGFFPALYQFNALQTGNINISAIVGAIVGCAFGPGCDWLLEAIAKRRKGYFKPEYRLWCLVPIFLFGPVGLSLWGFGIGNHLQPMVPIAGVGILYAILCAGATVTFTYVVDSYRSIAGEAVSILIAFRNTMAFGLSFAIFPWFEKDGFIKVTGYMILIQGLIFLLAIPMYIYGPRARAWTSTFLV